MHAVFLNYILLILLLDYGFSRSIQKRQIDDDDLIGSFDNSEYFASNPSLDDAVLNLYSNVQTLQALVSQINDGALLTNHSSILNLDVEDERGQEEEVEGGEINQEKEQHPHDVHELKAENLEEIEAFHSEERKPTLDSASALLQTLEHPLIGTSRAADDEQYAFVTPKEKTTYEQAIVYPTKIISESTTHEATTKKNQPTEATTTIDESKTENNEKAKTETTIKPTTQQTAVSNSSDVLPLNINVPAQLNSSIEITEQKSLPILEE